MILPDANVILYAFRPDSAHLEILAEWLSSVVDAGPRHWTIFRDLCQATNASGNLVPDAWLAALAIEHGCEWITADRNFARFPGLRWRTID